MSKSAKILVKTEINWADECDFDGFEIWDKDKLEKAKEEVQNYFENDGAPFEVYFGTNEYNEIESYDDIFDNVKEIKISTKEASVIKKLFGGKNGFTLSNILDYLNQE